jgi:hypothetical protein
MGCKKKIYQFRPKETPQEVEVQKTKTETESVSVTSVSIERDVRQMLADKISGTLVGLWLLIPEHLRLGTWDLLMSWSQTINSAALYPRLALQLIHESVLCLNGIRKKRSLRHKGFEVLNGLPFVAHDTEIHQLLDQHSMADANALQCSLGQLRYTSGHYPSTVVLVDPHRIQTWTKRHLPLNKTQSNAPTRKTLQTFFAIDSQSGQPLACGMGSSAVTISQATIPLVEQLTQILPHSALIIGDGEHFTGEILSHLTQHEQFSFLFPIPQHQTVVKQLPNLTYQRVWAAYAVAEWEYPIPKQLKKVRVIVQRTGEQPDNYNYKPFATTSNLPAADLMTELFPERWNIEEFFCTEAAMGWKRASTLNLNIRFNKMSLGLISQAVVHQFRQNLPPELSNATATNLAEKVFSRIDGDIRVKDDTIIVTLYNAPNEAFFKEQYTNLPQKLTASGVNPKIPWLYDLKLDFRFK